MAGEIVGRAVTATREAPAIGAALDRLIGAIEMAGYKVTDRKGTTARAQCPAHQGTGQNLSIFSTETRVNVRCHSRGCTTEDVLEALGMTWRDRYHERKAEYVYDNRRKVTRWDGKKRNGKGFNQSGTDSPPELYRKSKVQAAVAAGERIWLVEGEEDVHAAEAVGAVATTAPQGATNFAKVDVSPLVGADVYAMPDQDDKGGPGDQWAAQVLATVGPIAKSLRFVRAKTGKDLCDHLAAEHTLDQLVPIEDDGAEDEPAPTWAPIDLTVFLDGTHVTPEPLLMPRTDGICLLYSGLTHSMHGESESGKSLVMQAESVRVLNSGGRVLFIDFESDPASVVGRLLDLGADPAALAPAAGRFVYLQPETDMRSSSAEAAAWLQVLSTRFDLAVIDGVTVSLGIFEYATKDNDNLAQWARLLPDRIARKTGAAVVSIDHVTKDPETRGRFAIGGQAKMAALTGAAYIVEATEALGRGLRGVVTLRVGKDRPGYIRARAGDWRARDRTQEVARVVVDSTGDETRVSVEPPADAGTFRPTVLMERISKWLESNGPAGVNEIRKQVKGKAAGKDEALRVLVQEGYVTVTSGPNNSKLHHSTRVFRAATEDSAAGTHPGSENSENPVGECVPPYTTGRGTHPQSASGTHRGRGDTPGAY